MKKRIKRFRKTKALLNIALAAVLVAQSVVILNPVTSKASSRPAGSTQSFIVRYNGAPVSPQRGLAVASQKAQLKERANWLAGQLSNESGYIRVKKRLSYLPYVLVEADAKGEQSLRANPNVVSAIKNRRMKVAAANFVEIPEDIGGSIATGFSDGENDYTGDGYAIGVIDAGIETSSPLFTGKILSEACYGLNLDLGYGIATSMCPGGVEASTAPGSSDVGDCTDVNDGCSHGTAVSAIAMGNPTSHTDLSEPADFSGVAKDAQLIAIQDRTSLQEIAGQEDLCGDELDEEEICEQQMNIMEGLDRIIGLATDSNFTTPIAAVNLSLAPLPEDTETPFYSDQQACDEDEEGFGEMIGPVAAVLSQYNVAMVVSAGNSGAVAGREDTISPLACVSNVISVGASTKNGHMTSYSSAGPLLDIVALGGEKTGPNQDGGVAVPTGVTGSEWGTGSGTSFAAPQVAGAYAVMREKSPTLSVQSILTILRESGTNIVEDRDGYTERTHKQLNLSTALAASDNMPNITGITGPSSGVTSGSTIALTIAAENATDCAVVTGGSGATNDFVLSGSQQTINVAVPTTGNSVTYFVLCYDEAADEYVAQSFATFAITDGNTDPDPDPNPNPDPDPDPTPTQPDLGGPINFLTAADTQLGDEWVPGSPDSGVTVGQRVQTVTISGICLLALFMLNKSYMSAFRR